MKILDRDTGLEVERLYAGSYVLRPPPGRQIIVVRLGPPAVSCSMFEVPDGGKGILVVDDTCDLVDAPFDVLMSDGDMVVDMKPIVCPVKFEGVTLSPPRRVDGLPPIVSCIMITQPSRLEMAKKAVACFNGQDYRRKELVVVSTGDISALGVRFLRAPSSLTLGELRNAAVARASGDIVAVWDDDDLSAPGRLSAQVERLMSDPRADACLLRSIFLAWPARGRYAVSRQRPRGWEPTMLAWRHRMPKYEPLNRGEDTVLVERMKVISLDMPSLYTYLVHGSNTWGEEHFNQIFADADETVGPGDPRRVMVERMLGVSSVSSLNLLS